MLHVFFFSFPVQMGFPSVYKEKKKQIKNSTECRQREKGKERCGCMCVRRIIVTEIRASLHNQVQPHVYIQLNLKLRSSSSTFLRVLFPVPNNFHSLICAKVFGINWKHIKCSHLPKTKAKTSTMKRGSENFSENVVPI